MSDDGLDPDLAALFDQKQDEEPMETNGVAAPEAPVRKGPPRRRGRGPDKRPRVMGRPAPTPASGDAAQVAAAAPEPSPHSVPPLTDFEGSRDALVVWPRVLQIVRDVDGFTADQISIRVTRVPVGSVELSKVRSQTSELVPILGSQVEGDTNLSPSEALYYTIVNDYHMSYSGPAIYKLSFQYRFGKSGNIPGVPANCEIKLDHPSVLKSQFEAKERKARDDAIRSGAPIGRSFNPGQPYYPPPVQGQTSQPATHGMTQREIDLMRALERENGQWQGRFQAMQNAPPPAVAAPPVAPARDPRLPPEGVSAEEWDQIQENRQARGVGKAVVQALTAMGFTPQTMQALQAPMQPQVGALPVAAPTTTDPLAGFNQLIGMMDGLSKMKKNLAKAFGVEIPEEGAAEKEEKEEDPTQMKPVLGGAVFPGTDAPMAYGPKLEDETWPEYIVRLGTHNPAMAMAALEKVAKVLDPKVLSGLVEKIVAAGAAKQAPPTGAAPTPQVEAPKKTGWQPT